MKKSRKWLLRFFSLAVIISVLFSLAIPASADVYDARDFIWGMQVHQNTTEIDYHFDAMYTEVRVYDVADNYRVIYQDSGSMQHNIPFIPGRQYRITLCPFGFRAVYNGLLASNIPSTFTMRTGFGYVYNTEDTGYATIPQPNVIGYWYESGSVEYQSYFPIGTTGEGGRTVITTDPYQLEVPDGADVLSFEFQWNNVSWESDPVPEYIVLEDFSINCTVDNRLLLDHFYEWTDGSSYIRDQLIDRVGNIDDVLNGPSNLKPPSNIEGVEDIEKLEQELLDQIDGEIGNLDALLESFNDVILEIGPSLLFVSWIIDLFTSMSFFTKLINVVISLGITAFVLNLIISFVHSRTENNKSREAHKDQKGG